MANCPKSWCAHLPGHARLTPSNCDDLLFDDVMWVENAKRDHFDFVTKMRDRGVEVVEMHNLLTETLAVPEARAWILDQQIVPNQVGVGLVDEVRSHLDELPTASRMNVAPVTDAFASWPASCTACHW